jgi:hypothetical protein
MALVTSPEVVLPFHGNVGQEIVATLTLKNIDAEKRLVVKMKSNVPGDRIKVKPNKCFIEPNTELQVEIKFTPSATSPPKLERLVIDYSSILLQDVDFHCIWNQITAWKHFDSKQLTIEHCPVSDSNGLNGAIWKRPEEFPRTDAVFHFGALTNSTKVVRFGLTTFKDQQLATNNFEEKAPWRVPAPNLPALIGWNVTQEGADQPPVNDVVATEANAWEAVAPESALTNGNDWGGEPWQVQVILYIACCMGEFPYVRH